LQVKNNDVEDLHIVKKIELCYIDFNFNLPNV